MRKKFVRPKASASALTKPLPEIPDQVSQTSTTQAEVLPSALNKNRKLIPVVQDDGRVAMHDEDTGEFINYQELMQVKYQPYDPVKAEVLLSRMSEGIPFKRALEDACISYPSFLKWQRSISDFRSIINTARQNRSMHMHEAFYDHDMRAVQSLTANYEDQSVGRVEWVDKQLKNIERKQKILKGFQEVDAPSRFGKLAVTQEAHSEVAIKIDMSVPDELKKIVDAGYRARLNEEGEFEVKGIEGAASVVR